MQSNKVFEIVHKLLKVKVNHFHLLGTNNNYLKILLKLIHRAGAARCPENPRVTQLGGTFRVMSGPKRPFVYLLSLLFNMFYREPTNRIRINILLKAFGPKSITPIQ